jgi:protein TonB
LIFGQFHNISTVKMYRRKPEETSGERISDISQMTEARFRLGNDIAENIEYRAAPSNDFIGLGMSIGIHAAGLLSFLLLATFHMSRSTFEAPVVFVHLTQLSESGWETGGVLHPDAAGGGASPSSAAQKAPDTQTAAPAPPAAVHKTAHVPNPHTPVIVKRLRTAVSLKPRRVEKTYAKTEDASPPANSVHPVKSPAATPDRAVTNSQLPPSPVPASQAEPSSTGGAGSDSGSSPDGNTGHGYGTGAGNVVGKGSGCGIGGGSGSGSGGDMGGEFGLKQVDQAPVPIRKVTPEFPEAARKLGASGKVLLKFLVKADGSVIRASVVEASPAGLFDHSALDAVCKWRFTPGVYHGHAVATWVMLPVYFRLSR